MSDDSLGFSFFFGIVIGALITSLIFICNVTQDGAIISGKEFFLSGAVRQCSVVHKLDSAQESK